MGESRGHFEGNTLVVRTTNLNGRTGMQGNGMMLMPSDALELVERFTPISADVLQYEVTVNDPEDLDRAVEGRVSAQARVRLSVLRVRLPRRKQRDAQHPVGLARRRARRGSREVVPRLTRRRLLRHAGGAAAALPVAGAARDLLRRLPIAGQVRRRPPTSPDGWRATWWPRATANFRRRWCRTRSTASWTPWRRWCRAPRFRPATRPSATCARRAARSRRPC